MAYNVLIVEDQDMPRQLLEIYLGGSEQFHHLASITNASAALAVSSIRPSTVNSLPLTHFIGYFSKKS